INAAARRDNTFAMEEICAPYRSRTNAASSAGFAFGASQNIAYSPTFAAADSVASVLAQAAQNGTFREYSRPMSQQIEFGTVWSDASVKLPTAPANTFVRNPSLIPIPNPGAEAVILSPVQDRLIAVPPPVSRPGSSAIAAIRDSTILRDSLLARNLRPNLGTPVNVLESFEMYVVPDEAAGLVARAEQFREIDVRQDCTNLACGSGWVGVTAEVDGEFVRGFARPDSIRSVAPVETLEFPVGGSQILTEQAFSEIERLVKGAIELNGHIQIVLVDVIPQEPTSSVYTAKNRLTLRSLEAQVLEIESRGKKLDRDNLAMQLIGSSLGQTRLVTSLRLSRSLITQFQ
ncbi:MAG: hypothetical protein AAGA22_04325, partial [Pseudomonadota bacterium]